MNCCALIGGATATIFVGATTVAAGALAGDPTPRDLVIVEAGEAEAVAVVSPKAEGWERAAAQDLVHYVELMSGARPVIADTRAAIDAALERDGPTLVIGSEALSARRGPLERALASVARKKPFIRADAIALQRSVAIRQGAPGRASAPEPSLVAQLLQARLGRRPGRTLAAGPERPRPARPQHPPQRWSVPPAVLV